jgi:hypothetical protein
MIEVIIALILMGGGIIGLIIVSANAKNKAYRIAAEIIACVGILLLCTIIGCAAPLPERDTAEAAKIETSEGEQKLEIVPVETSANITITTESLTDEQLIKAFIEKWDGVLPDTIIINVGGNEDELS